MLFSAKMECSFSKLFKNGISQYVGGISLGTLIILSLTLALVLYMIAKLIKNARILFIAKDELFQLLLSAFILASIMFFITGACMFTAEVFNYAWDKGVLSSNMGFSSDPVSDASTMLKQYSNKLTNRIMTYIDLSIKFKIDSAVMYMAYNPTDGGEIVPVGAHKSAYSMVYDLLVFNFALPALVSINIQKLILLFIRDFGGYLIVLGILFRLIRPIRNIGNVFLALSVVLLILYPILYLFMILSVNSIMDQHIPFNNSGSNSLQIEFLWQLSMLMIIGYLAPTFVIAISVSFTNSLSRAISIIGT